MHKWPPGAYLCATVKPSARPLRVTVVDLNEPARVLGTRRAEQSVQGRAGQVVDALAVVRGQRAARDEDQP